MLLVPVRPTLATPDEPVITDKEAEAMARSVIRLFERWQLSDQQAATLLGGMARRTWSRLKQGEMITLGRDLRMRLSLLMGIHKGLRYLFVDRQRGYGWIHKANQRFNGHSALDVMMRGEITDLIAVRSYLDAERGGW